MTVGSRWRTRRWRYRAGPPGGGPGGHRGSRRPRHQHHARAGEDDITRALAPGQTDEAAREQAREVLVRAAAEKAQAEWLEGARRRAAIRVLIPDGAVIPPPFPPP